ncbi:MAG: insulinase family protein [Sedimentisphaerales bacterium]|nr:insulinase family protein [Sedimentisphaerales bacterium]
MTEKIDTYKLSNGMTVLGIPMASVQSAAIGLLLPAGAATIPDGCCGAGTIIADWIFRGTKDKTNRELADALDGLGLLRNSNVESKHIALSAALDASNLLEAIELYAQMILNPALDSEQFEYSKQLALQGLLSLEDDPRHETMLLLKEHFYPDPLGRNTAGKKEDLQNLTAEKTKQIISENFDLSQTILAIAGKYDIQKLRPLTEKLFAGEKPKSKKEINTKEPLLDYHHHPHDGSQVHIGIMTQSATPQSGDYYNARVATAILSGGMSSRLFEEVREKRGLCYIVSAGYHCLKETAGIACYAGTTPDKAQETYDVIIKEFRRLAEDIDADELQRAKIGLKSGLVMQSESTMARAQAAATDHYILGKVRNLEEILQNIDKTSIKSIVDFLKNNPFENFCSVTTGPVKIKPV